MAFAHERDYRKSEGLLHISGNPTNQELLRLSYVDAKLKQLSSRKFRTKLLVQTRTDRADGGDLSGKFGPVPHRPTAGCPAISDSLAVTARLRANTLAAQR
jgi:hypothetical protein